MRIFLYITFIVLSSLKIQAQNNIAKDKLVQISGLITSKVTDKPVPFATIHIKGTFRGTIAAVDGFYTMVAAERDTLEYVAYGYKTFRYIVPANVKDHKANSHVKLLSDTFTYRPLDSFPYASKEEFKQAFISAKLDKTYEDLAKKNLDPQKMAELYETLARDGNEMQMYTLQQIAASYYYAGGQRNYLLLGSGSTPIPTSLLNPFAWGEFIKSIKQGKYKKKKVKDFDDY
ncbi:MAG: carboxypeptidase-like regulatory domain-containing protein [Bacteroidota bacterium]|nr:carboxypeptidase-like regulatory domain-containing protein [Bacteroidota bacterium]